MNHSFSCLEPLRLSTPSFIEDFSSDSIFPLQSGQFNRVPSCALRTTHTSPRHSPDAQASTDPNGNRSIRSARRGNQKSTTAYDASAEHSSVSRELARYVPPATVLQSLHGYANPIAFLPDSIRIPGWGLVISGGVLGNEPPDVAVTPAAGPAKRDDFIPTSLFHRDP